MTSNSCQANGQATEASPSKAQLPQSRFQGSRHTANSSYGTGTLSASSKPRSPLTCPPVHHHTRLEVGAVEGLSPEDEGEGGGNGCNPSLTRALRGRMTFRSRREDHEKTWQHGGGRATPGQDRWGETLNAQFSETKSLNWLWSDPYSNNRSMSCYSCFIPHPPLYVSMIIFFYRDCGIFPYIILIRKPYSVVCFVSQCINLSM
ncbi:hypothetical protein GBAR_LOCUS7506 [Geodia barretti]|uniref:Uncharacterized protein n=1 Tax=Geodia barretti TaxID=519541 RepID=A0AA35RJE1_GEOBA|nr:hypothetical protein GBAR_LOCUS7506 [Geodia barretti]